MWDAVIVLPEIQFIYIYLLICMYDIVRLLVIISIHALCELFDHSYHIARRKQFLVMRIRKWLAHM